MQAVDEEWATTSLYEAADDTARVDDLWSRYQVACEHIGATWNAREAAA